MYADMRKGLDKAMLGKYDEMYTFLERGDADFSADRSECYGMYYVEKIR